jgi:hypothetical protein
MRYGNIAFLLTVENFKLLALGLKGEDWNSSRP